MSFTTRVLIILTSLNLLQYMDRYLIASLGTLVKGEMGLSDRAFGLLGTAFFLVYLLTSPIFGYLGDRWGHVRLMAWGAVLWSLATSLTYWVGSYFTLLLARGAVGVGEASFGTLSPAYIADILPLSPVPGHGLVLCGPAGGLGPGLSGGRPDRQPLGLASGLSAGGTAGPGDGRSHLASPGGPQPRPVATRPGPPAPPMVRRPWSLLKIPTLRWVSLGFG